MSNPNKLPWTKYQDIQVQEAELKKEFDAYITAGDYAEALMLLRTQEQRLKGRAYVSKSINEIVSSAVFLESQFNDGVNVFLSDLASKYYNLVEEFGNMGNWDPNILYRPYNFVKYENSIYMAYVDCAIGTLPTDDSCWLYLGLAGQVGAPGMDINVRYQWNASKPYAEKDLVAHNKNLYIAKKPSTGIEPGTDETVWMLFVMITEGKIEVGVTEPTNPVQNMIWLKTETNPLDAVGPVIVQVQRYRVDGTWEAMHPLTFFGLVEGRENYAPKAIYTTIVLRPEDWGYLDNMYGARVADSVIGANSYVVAMPGFMESHAYNLYSNLMMTVKQGAIIFKSRFKPDVDISIFVSVQ